MHDWQPMVNLLVAIAPLFGLGLRALVAVTRHQVEELAQLRRIADCLSDVHRLAEAAASTGTKLDILVTDLHREREELRQRHPR